MNSFTKELMQQTLVTLELYISFIKSGSRWPFEPTTPEIDWWVIQDSMCVRWLLRWATRVKKYIIFCTTCEHDKFVCKVSYGWWKRDHLKCFKGVCSCFSEIIELTSSFRRCVRVLDKLQWVVSGRSTQNNAMTVSTAGKVMEMVFWDWHGVFFTYSLEKDKTYHNKSASL